MQGKQVWIFDGLIIGIITTILMMLFFMVYEVATDSYQYVWYIDEIIALAVCLPIFESIAFFIPNLLGGLLSKFIDQKYKSFNQIFIALISSFVVIVIFTLVQTFDIVYGWKNISEYFNFAIKLGIIDGIIFCIIYLLSAIITRKLEKLSKQNIHEE